MRIIGGTHRGRRIAAPKGGHTRPTGDRVREALFNLVGPVDGASVLDLYAGSGALGLEALSRGANTAEFVEVQRNALAALKANLKTLKVEGRTTIHKIDALRFAEQLHPGQYDVAFADPPYANVNNQTARLVAMFRLVPFARVFSIEHPADAPMPGDETRRYGDTAVTFIYAP
jgi:16S rRNA (guanine966-N2)-methyltransferase